MRRFHFGLVLWISLAHAQGIADDARTSGIEKEALPAHVYLQGILLVGEEAELYADPPTIHGLEVNNVRIPGGLQKLRDRLELEFMGKRITPELLLKIRNEIRLYYELHCYPIPNLVTPSQSFKGGVLQILVEDPLALSDEEKTEIRPLEKEALIVKDQDACDGSLEKEERLSQRPIIPIVNTLVLTGCLDAVGMVDCENGLYLYEIDPPGRFYDLKKRLEPIFYGKPLTQEILKQLKREILLFYQCHHRPVVTVFVPEQDVTEGTLYLVVMESKVGRVTITGNCFFRKGVYKRRLRAYPDRPIHGDWLANDVAWLNRNPFRNVDLFYGPGECEGTTDIELRVKDRLPVEVYGGADNTGSGAIGEARWFTGFNWGNAFFLDHFLNYQYTSSVRKNALKSQTVFYQAPLPWRHLLNLYGGYATVRPQISGFETKEGHDFQASARYIVPIGKTYGGTLQEAVVGFDFKNTDNNLIFVGEEDIGIITNTVNLTQFLFGYHYGKQNDVHKADWNFELFWSPGKLVDHQSREDYDSLSAGAQNKYVYGRLFTSQIWFLPYRYTVSLIVRGQLSDESLLPSEQFGLGGYDTVRGYLEREYNADSALCANFIIGLRPFSILHFFHCRKVEDALTLIAFVDYGLGYLHDRTLNTEFSVAEPTLRKYQNLLGVGPGIRYTIGRYLSARADWGIRLKTTPFSSGSQSRFYLGIVISI